MRRSITLYGDPVLHQQGEAVTDFGPDLQKLAEDMVETMYAEEGIGLAAQQVGLALRFCVVDTQLPEAEIDFDYELDGRRPPLSLLMPMALANPEIQMIETAEVPFEEGCLSFPGLRGEVKRPDPIEVRYQDLRGEPHVLRCDGLLSRVIQHEVDHLDGVLFIDRMAPPVRKRLEKRLQQLLKA